MRAEIEKLKQEKTKTEALFDWYGDEDDDGEEKTLDKNPTPMPDDTKDSKQLLTHLAKERMQRENNLRLNAASFST